MKSVTTQLRPGYLRKNGVPYSASTVFTEYWDLQTETNGDQYLVDTNIVNDPVYLQSPWITAIHFKKEPEREQVGPEPLRRKVLARERSLMNGIGLTRIVALAGGLLAMSVPAFAQIELTGSYTPLLYEDYIERGPGSDLGDFTGMPLNDEARAKALLYTSNLPSTVERQCLAQAPWVEMYRPRGISIWREVDGVGRVIAWKLGGDYLRDTVTIWMDGRPEPSPNVCPPPPASRPGSGKATR